MINVVCTSKPGDGLLRYSYEHNCALNSLGIKTQLVIIPNPKHTKEEYIKSIRDQYKNYKNVLMYVLYPLVTHKMSLKKVMHFLVRVVLVSNAITTYLFYTIFLL